MRIAIPSHPFYRPLIERALDFRSKAELQFREGTEQDCIRLLLANSVDLALVSPLGYGRGVVNNDFRIVPTTACILKSWTNVGSIYFAENLKDVARIASPTPQDFLMHCAHILLDEQYEISAELELNEEPLEVQLKDFHSVVKWHHHEDTRRGLDISEEWDNAFSQPLPLALWVCRNEYILDGGAESTDREKSLLNLTRSFASEGLLGAELRLESEAVADTEQREGVIEWTWTSDSEELVNQMLQLLYYRQLIREIPAVKLVGRD